MSTFGLFEAKNRLSELVARAGAGEEVVITKHGRPAARLVAFDSADDREARRRRIDESMERVRVLREGLRRRLSIEEILEARHEGHRH
jgi:prevent-host-death family protein